MIESEVRRKLKTGRPKKVRKLFFGAAFFLTMDQQFFLGKGATRTILIIDPGNQKD